MRRARLTSVAVIVSAALGYGVICLWIYTCTPPKRPVSVVNYPGPFVVVAEGQVRFGRTNPPRTPTRAERATMIAVLRPANAWSFLGFAFENGEYQNPVRIMKYWRGAVPLWFFVVLLGLPGVVRLRRRYGQARDARCGFEIAPARP